MKTQPFHISAYSATLLGNSERATRALFDSEANFRIPVYQRPYSWGEVEVKALLDNIYVSYSGDGIEQEAMFIGTMQLSASKGNSSTREIIDGQQRLSTLLLLIKVLSRHCAFGCDAIDSLFGRITSAVNSGQQQEYLHEALSDLLPGIPNQLNRYSVNLHYIDNTVSKWLDQDDTDTDEGAKGIKINALLNYILQEVYFVVIETQAGLSKTLKIFDAINTTGMDLAGSDLFKIRMYEYLNRDAEQPQLFDEINRIYKRVEDYKKEFHGDFPSIEQIRGIYQRILIASLKLPTILYTYNVDTFFDRLFDTVLKVQKWEHFRTDLPPDTLSLIAVNDIIDACYVWESNEYSTAETHCAMNFIWWSRYGRYGNIAQIFLYSFRHLPVIERWKNMEVVMTMLSKILVSYSIRFHKVVNEAHAFIYEIISTITKQDYESLIKKLNSKLSESSHREQTRKGIADEIVWNSKVKNLVCRMSAMLHEDYKSQDAILKTAIAKRIFDENTDIEHIQPYLDSDLLEREKIHEDWGVELNSLGNLIIYPRALNRSQSNAPYINKRLIYQESEYKAVKRLAELNPEWKLENAKQRKDAECQLICEYLFGG